MEAFAKELVASQVEIILSSTTPATAALHRETNTIPIVFTVVVDPVRAGFVANLLVSRRQHHGVRTHEPAFVGKSGWSHLEEIVPDIKRAAIMFNPARRPTTETSSLGSFEAAARSWPLSRLPLRYAAMPKLRRPSPPLATNKPASS